jgi:5-methyltetrahydropteroyltriglutamate--homocysteine methyltransferase
MDSIKIHNLGLPRIGQNRELKRAVESHWKGDLSQNGLEEIGAKIREGNRQLQEGFDYYPANDFSFYDQVLDMSFLLGVIPERVHSKTTELDQYFATARGSDCSCASEMTKWFNTNYHYIVPEISDSTNFEITSRKIFVNLQEAADKKSRPVLIGPVTYLTLAASQSSDNKLQYLDKILPVYTDILCELKELGAEWVQIDEPIFSLDLSEEQNRALIRTYEELSVAGPKILLVNYFGELGQNLELFFKLPVHGFHIDAVEAKDEVHIAVDKLPQGAILSLGVIDGKNIWRSDYQQILDLVKPISNLLGNLWLAPSCSLLHAPFSLEGEDTLDPELKSWLSFSKEKLQELIDIKQLLDNQLGADHILFENQQMIASRQNHHSVKVAEVRQRTAELVQSQLERSQEYGQRAVLQKAHFNLPVLPTTTIGSFPQTKEVRKIRSRFKKGSISLHEYDQFLDAEVARVMELQKEIGLDVLVHGEPERNDMVEYFGEELNGYAFTKNGWVQSYGSRCVKPPIIYGDVSRKGAITVKWSLVAKNYAGETPLKGMLTGPITMLKWSFVRNDLALDEVANQIAFALRDEVGDLEAAGIEIIQVDEPAIREALPLKEENKESYLKWAVEAFKISTCGVKNTTQIHTHMCYSDFNEIISAISELDADVISVETSRSKQALLEVFKNFKYPNEIGPGVYDIHSPRVPGKAEILEHIHAASEFVDIDKLWINPDCGLKTRAWPETVAALKNMVSATQQARQELALLV